MIRNTENESNQNMVKGISSCTLSHITWGEEKKKKKKKKVCIKQRAKFLFIRNLGTRIPATKKKYNSHLPPELMKNINTITAIFIAASLV